MMFQLLLRFPDRLVDLRNKPFAERREKESPHRHERDSSGSNRLHPSRRAPVPNSLQIGHPSRLDALTVAVFFFTGDTLIPPDGRISVAANFGAAIDRHLYKAGARATVLGTDAVRHLERSAAGPAASKAG